MTLQALLERVEKAEGPDRKLDLALCEALKQEMDWSGDLVGLGSKPYTASIDAAVALVEKMLPGCEWWCWNKTQDEQDNPLGPGAMIWDERIAGASKGDSYNGATPALALIAALLRAMIAKEKE